jgi:hypothetical protein
VLLDSQREASNVTPILLTPDNLFARSWQADQEPISVDFKNFRHSSEAVTCHKSDCFHWRPLPRRPLSNRRELVGRGEFDVQFFDSQGTRKPHERASFSSWSNLTRRQTVVPIAVTAANIDTASLYNAEFDPTILFEVFKRVIHPQPTDVSYTDIRQQWVFLSHRQFVNSPELQELIIGLESQIQKQTAKFDRFAEPRKVKQTLFEILLTYALYNWDATQSLTGIVDLVLPFIDAYILQFGSLEGCAPAVFELFAGLYEHETFAPMRVLEPKFIQSLLVDVGKRIASMFPELLQWLNQKQVFTLDFLKDDFRRWFVDVFNDEEVKVLWISILSRDNTLEFFESFVIALLLILMPELNELIPLSSREFIDRFNQVKIKADLRTLLVNTQQIHGMFHPPG